MRDIQETRVRRECITKKELGAKEADAAIAFLYCLEEAKFPSLVGAGPNERQCQVTATDFSIFKISTDTKALAILFMTRTADIQTADHRLMRQEGRAT